MVREHARLTVAATRATLPAGNLPVELTSFVGRRQGLADLRRALSSARLMLTGVGGVGKTRLALRAGRENARQYPDGVWFVELAPVQDPELVPQAVFTAFGLQDHSSKRAVAQRSPRVPHRQAPTPHPRQLRARARRRRRARRHAPARVSRRPDPRHHPPAARDARRGRDRAPGAVPARAWAMTRPSPAPLRFDPALRGASARSRIADSRSMPPNAVSDPQHLPAISTASRSPSSSRPSGSSPSGLDGPTRPRCPSWRARTGDRSAALRQQTLEGALDWSSPAAARARTPAVAIAWRCSRAASSSTPAQAVCAADGLYHPRPSRSSSGRSSRIRRSSAARTPRRSLPAPRAAPPVRPRNGSRDAARGAHAALAACGLDRPALPRRRRRRGCAPGRPVTPHPGGTGQRLGCHRLLSGVPLRPSATPRSAATCGSIGSTQGPISDVRRVFAALLDSIPGRETGTCPRRCRPQAPRRCVLQNELHRSQDRCSRRLRRSAAPSVTRMLVARAAGLPVIGLVGRWPSGRCRLVRRRIRSLSRGRCTCAAATLHALDARARLPRARGLRSRRS